MDKATRREWLREWLAVGVRENLTFKQLAYRARVNERTLRNWNKIFREESARRATPDQAERAFVDLLERTAANATRIEIVLPGERRIVIDGAAIVEAVARVITTVGPC
jgi:hypothetical protein